MTIYMDIICFKKRITPAHAAIKLRMRTHPFYILSVPSSSSTPQTVWHEAQREDVL